MGGYGSGQRWGGSKDLTSDYKRLDILWMNREGLLNPGHTGSVTWSCDGEQIGWIRYSVERNALRLIYRSRAYGEDWQDIDYRVPLDWADCRFGGQRPYFLCPNAHCGRRVQHLYAGSPYFLCRHCQDLAYPCQREEPFERASRRVEKIYDRLGVEHGYFDAPPLFKPKGMHEKTWQRLRTQANHHREIALGSIVQRFNLLRI